MEKLTGVKDDRSLSLFAKLPDALVIDEAGEDEDALRALLNETLAQALDSLNAMRAREGEAMKRDMLEKLEEIEEKNALIEKRYPETVDEYREKLRARVNELLATPIDEARLAQEVALMADRAAVAEETVRLSSHIR